MGPLFTAPEYRTISYVSFTNADAQAQAVRAPKPTSRPPTKNASTNSKHPEYRTVDQLIYDSEDKAKKALALTELRAGTSPEQVGKTTRRRSIKAPSPWARSK